jgi:hypothetical protein
MPAISTALGVRGSPGNGGPWGNGSHPLFDLHTF